MSQELVVWEDFGGGGAVRLIHVPAAESFRFEIEQGRRRVSRVWKRPAGEAFAVSPTMARDDADALRVGAQMAVNLGGAEIAQLMREVAARIERYGYG